MAVLASSLAVALPVLFLCSGATSVANPRSVEYLSTSPGHYVEYLSLIDSGQDVSGFLESVRLSKASPDKEERTTMAVSAKNNGDVIVIGDRTVTRTADGYTLTYPTSTGEVGQQRFTRSTIQQVNTSIRDFSRELDQARKRSEAASAKAELRRIAAAIVSQAVRISQYQNIVDAATAKQAELQHKADPLVAIAHALRDKAVSVIDTAGADWLQNRLRIAAMKNAEDAEESAAIAQREADAVGAAAAAARADLSDARIQMARLGARTRVLSATTGAGGAMGMMMLGGTIARR